MATPDSEKGLPQRVRLSAVHALGPALIALLCWPPVPARAAETVDRLVRPPLQRVGIIVPSAANPYFSRLTRGAIDRLLQLNPKAKVRTADTAFFPTEEAKALEQMAAAQVQLVLLASACRSGCGQQIAAVRDAGILVVAVDIEADGADATIESDNRLAGQSTCRYLAEQIGGHGKFIIQNGPQVSSVTQRVEGCKETLRQYPAIELLADSEDGLGSPWGGNMLMRTHLQRFPHIDAVFAINDRQALGAEAAALKMGRREMLIGSVDASPELLETLTRPGLIVVSARQDPVALGRRGIEIGLALLEGSYTGPRHILLPTPLVTRAPGQTEIRR
jgi:ribose transport system substrate-binding protein